MMSLAQYAVLCFGAIGVGVVYHYRNQRTVRARLAASAFGFAYAVLLIATGALELVSPLISLDNIGAFATFGLILHLLRVGTRRTVLLACGLAIISSIPALPAAVLPLAVTAFLLAFIRSCFERDGLHGDAVPFR